MFVLQNNQIALEQIGNPRTCKAKRPIQWVPKNILRLWNFLATTLAAPKYFELDKVQIQPPIQSMT